MKVPVRWQYSHNDSDFKYYICKYIFTHVFVHVVLPPVLVPRQSEYAPQQTLQQYQTPVEVGMPMNVSMSTDGFPEGVLTTNQTASNVPNQIPPTNTINSFPDSSLLGINDNMLYLINYIIFSFMLLSYLIS